MHKLQGLPPKHTSAKALRLLQRRIGNNIHVMRREQNLTLVKLSQQTGLSVDRLDRYELGRNTSHLRELMSIAAALGISVAYLFNRVR